MGFLPSYDYDFFHSLTSITDEIYKEYPIDCAYIFYFKVGHSSNFLSQDFDAFLGNDLHS